MAHFLTRFGMIRRLFCGTILLYCVSTEAQTNFRFADSTAVWTQCHAAFLEGPQGTWATYSTDVYRVDGDTFFNNENYQKIVPGYPNYEVPHAWIRKDSLSRVFLYDTSISSDRMLYDFSLNQGDTLRLYKPASWFEEEDTIKFVVDSTDSVTYGVTRKRMFVRCVTATYCSWFTGDVVIEGIGSLNSHFLSPYIYEFLVIPGDAFNLLYFEENGSTYNFSSGCTVGVSELSYENIKIYPNPANGYLNVTGLTRQTTIQLYDLFGREVLTAQLTTGTNRIGTKYLTNGIYIYKVIGESKVGKVFIEK